jgi:hypothetical protein
MRMMMNIKFPNEKFNAYVKDGTIGAKLQGVLDGIKPEAAYFTEMDGSRGVCLIVNISDASQIPVLAEPWFILFNAECELRIVMSPADLANSGIDKMAKKWS